MFYSINVGLGVGYGQFQVVGSNGKMFTVAYCIMGARPVQPMASKTRALALAAAHSFKTPSAGRGRCYRCGKRT